MSPSTDRPIADRYRDVAAGFTARVDGVVTTPGSPGWDAPAPCDGWVARDVVRHLVEWVPPFLTGGADVTFPPGPAIADDPAGAWAGVNDTVQGLLDAPDVSERFFEHPQAGRHRLDEAISMFILGDVLVHTWDLARATGQDETLDPDEVAGMLAGVRGHDEQLRSSGHYGPKVEVPADADDQTRLIAFLGREP